MLYMRKGLLTEFDRKSLAKQVFVTYLDRI